ncbi:KPN_02809 family neutral zinc metallopeptidase [Pseudomonas sp. N040]|uniref:KPN_02809 family neutral zinc metallopeptidase n=1 Tax=Pseudomonas sp. N040 TaxID=2785325 RepID=UPI0018A27707|nr:neutral zinc metallopeptidase [Pseudomonas sp. N040]MBF7730663.1 neutral zinc metallopeptidase [Pseudomonas sp. N040]MBW7014306.1 neutral zinc metallopeptidase [Pseudomonas sp. N040]
MRWERGRRSDNVVDAGGGARGMRRGGRLSLTGVAIVVVVGLLMGQDPMQILGQLLGQAGVSAPPAATRSTQAPATSDPQREFVRAILGSTEDVWGQLLGKHYPQPKLVLFKGSVSSACGMASSASGPFYCTADQQIYLDLDFFRELEQRFAAAGDFAQAYVIAHEVGHHVQTISGLTEKIQRARQQGRRLEGADGLLVRQELQADCLAGTWAFFAQQQLQWLEPGDLEEALTAANAIGDDRLQKQARGTVMPDAFTHGTSAQRVHWFRQGFDKGDPGRCNTFAAARL